MATYEERIRYIVHRDKPVLLIDLSNCSPKEIGDISTAVPDFVSEQPMGSVLLLADFTGAEFDRQCIERLKVVMVLDRPHLKRSAWVGTETLPKVYYDNMKMFAQRDLPTFQNREEALEFLVGED